MSTNAIRHPSWCSPAHCQVALPAKSHYSRPVQARGRRDLDLTVTVQLFQSQSQPPDEPAHIGLNINYPAFAADEELDVEHAFDPELALTVGQLLTAAGRQAVRES
jgi:hypothetical protein